MKPEISVVLPFSNNADTLAKSIESIRSQSFEKFELLLIYSNPDDESQRIAGEYASLDPRILLHADRAEQIVHALNNGIHSSKGKYIAFLDAEDISHPERLRKQYDFLEKNKEFDLIGSCVNYINDEDMQFRLFEYVKWHNRIITHADICNNRFVGSPLIHSSVMFRRQLTKKHEMFRLGDFPEDHELWLRLLDKGIKMCKYPEVLIDWKDPSKKIALSHEQYASQAFYEIKTTYLYNWLKLNNRFHPKVVVWGAGYLARQRFSLLQDMGIDPKFFIDIRPSPKHKVIEYTHTPPAGRNFIVCYLSHPETREKIREFLVGLGYSEGKDFICFA